MVNHYIIIVSFCVLLLLLYQIINPIVWKKNLDNFIEIQNLLTDIVNENIVRYTNTKSVHDLLVGDVAISIEEYNNIVFDGCSYVLNNLPSYSKKLFFSYYTKTEIQDFIIREVTSKIDEVYTISFLEPIEKFEEENKRRSN